MQLATGRFHYIGVDEATRDAALRDIGGFDPEVQTLIWLAFIDAHLSEPSDVDTFYGWTGYFFPQMVAALENAGMRRRAMLFREGWQHPKQIVPAFPADLSDPKAFRTIDLGKAFGDKQAFETDMLAYVRNTPRVAAWYEAAHANLSERDRLDALLGMLIKLPNSYTREVLGTWPAPYRVLQLVALYDGEIINGGVEQFFANSSGDLAPETAEALRKLGLPEEAAYVDRGMAYFPQPYPIDRDRRLEALRGVGPDTETETDRRLYALRPKGLGFEPIAAAMAAYARRETILPR